MSMIPLNIKDFNHNHMDIHIKTAEHQLITLFTHEKAKIEAWFEEQWSQFTPPLYSSVDIRHAGFKVGAIDTNLFPGGFNNLYTDDLPLAISAAK